MTSGPYKTITAQAWSTYTSISGRTDAYTKLLQEPYGAFLSEVTKFDALTAKLNVSNPSPSDVTSAQNIIDTMVADFNAIVTVLDKFKTLDTQAVSKAATLDQGKVRAAMEQCEKYDTDFETDLNNVLYQCQMVTMSAMTANA